MNGSCMRNKKNLLLRLQKETIKGCLNKTVYSSRYTAEIEAAKFDKRAYKCSYCGLFHLTSQLE
jgi:hypothetical protein